MSLAMPTSDLLLLGIAALAVSVTLISSLCLVLKTRGRRDLPDHTPPVTIYKPLKGVDEDLEANLRTFFQLDYPVYQILFGIAEAEDPAIQVVERLMREFPDHDARLVIGTPAFGLNPKVENLASMARHRKHETILVSDSNVRVRPSYLRETACYLSNPAVGVVSNVFVGVDERQFGAALENLQLNGFTAGGVALASGVGATCVVGKSMLMPQRALQAIGGWASVRNLLAEDQAIGMKVRKAGYSIRLSHHVIENVNQSRGFHWFVNRHSRWYKIRRRMAGPAFLLEPIANLPLVGLVWALSSDSGSAWGGLALLTGLGIARDAFHSWWLRGSIPRFRHLLLSPIKDLCLLIVWLDALVESRVVWRGHRFLIGRYTRLRLGRPPRGVRRRVRRVRRLRARRDFPGQGAQES